MKKYDFTKEEIEYMKSETEVLKTQHQNFVPIYIQIKSDVLNMEKKKFLVADDIHFHDFTENTLRKKLIGLNTNDKLVINAINLSEETPILTELKPSAESIKVIYDKYKDTETDLLILRISRITPTKYIKKSIKNMIFY